MTRAAGILDPRIYVDEDLSPMLVAFKLCSCLLAELICYLLNLLNSSVYFAIPSTSRNLTQQFKKKLSSRTEQLSALYYRSYSQVSRRHFRIFTSVAAAAPLKLAKGALVKPININM